jgi:hypothetical protein
VTVIAPVAALDPIAAATTLFDTLVNVLTADGVEVPQLQGVVPGPTPAYDGEQFTVNLIGISRGVAPVAAAGYLQPQALQQYYEFEVNLLREVSVAESNVASATVPAMSDLYVDFGVIAADAAALWRAIVTIHASFLVVPANVPFLYGPLFTIEPQGGLSGCRLPVAWQAL